VTTPPPNFDQLVGTDLDPRERDRLRRVHELLVAAGPPPELSTEVDAPPTGASVHALPRRRGRGAIAALAAALGVLVFAVGYLAGARGDDPGTFDVVGMTGLGPAQDASATLEIYDVDEFGNWPMRVEVRGLQPSSSTGRLYELWLTKDGRLVAPCGRFSAEDDGMTVIPLNAPYRLSEYDEWVVVEQGSETPLLTT
jgi:hypothetical protein